MQQTDQKLEDAVLKRMLETPPTPHKGKKEGEPKPALSKVKRGAAQ